MLDELIKIDIKTLRSFMAIVECQGVTAAQSRLNVTTSVISGHLTHLEDRLGMTLCHRGRAGFKLTEDGAAVYEACLSFTEAVASFQHQLHYIRQLDSVRGGHIRLCLIDQMPTFFMTPCANAWLLAIVTIPLFTFLSMCKALKAC